MRQENPQPTQLQLGIRGSAVNSAHGGLLNPFYYCDVFRCGNGIRLIKTANNKILMKNVFVFLTSCILQIPTLNNGFKQRKCDEIRKKLRSRMIMINRRIAMKYSMNKWMSLMAL